MPPPPSKSKHRLIIGGLLAIVLLGGIVSFLTSGPKSNRPAARKSEFITVTLPPPPPPPPPPPKIEPPKPKEVEPPKDEEMVEQDPVEENEPPPEAAPEAPPSEDLGTNITGGSGPDMGLTRGGGNGNGRIGGTGSKGGSKWGYYAAQIQSTVADALRRNSSTKSASFSMQVRVWADANGRITRASLVGSSGNPAVDAAIKNQILTGLQLPQAPPAGMPMPINLRITARKSAL
jgi:TonB family protein